MNKRIYILLIISMLSGSAFGQFVAKDNLSTTLFYLQRNELDSAKKYIDLAVVDSNLTAQANTWYYKGFIYKELYKKSEKENPTSPHRETSIKAFKKMLFMKNNDPYIESTLNFLKYLASTLYNDAAKMLTPEHYETAINNYNLYSRIIQLTDKDINIEEKDVEFKLALASMLSSPNDTIEEITDSTIKHQVKELYREVLAIDSNNAASNYNLGIMYYNEGAEIINKMDYNTDLIKLMKTEDYCIEIFSNALPYMQKSYELGYRRKETLIGLQNIYYSLHEKEKSDGYKKELKELDN